MNIYDYQRRTSAIPAVTGYPGARRALAEPQTRTAGAEMGEFDVRKAIEAQGRIRDIAQAQHEIDLERETLGLMRKENVYGTIGTIGAIGVEGLGAWQARETEQEEAAQWEERKEELDLAIGMWNEFPNTYRQRFLSNLKAIYKRPLYPQLTPQFGGGK